MDLGQTLEKLEYANRQRSRAIKFHRAGVNALSEIDHLKDVRESWSTTGDPVEAALVVQAQNKWRPNGASDSLLRRLLRLKVYDVVPAPALNKSETPIFTATRALQALVGTPRYAFSRASLICYYAIIREIYTSQAPDWSTGGARAGAGARSTAFVTSDCMRALSTFARMHWRTAQFFRASARLSEDLRKLAMWKNVTSMKEWRSRETFRLALAWYTQVSIQLSGLSLQLDQVSERDLEDPRPYLNRLPKALRAEIQNVRSQFKQADEEIDAFRKVEEERLSARRIDLSETAHRIAKAAVEKAIEEAEAALQTLKGSVKRGQYLLTLADQFDRIDWEINRIAEPATGFVLAVLDRELASAAASEEAKIPWAPRELAFAAAAYGYSSGWRPDERLDRASTLLSRTLDAHGLLPTDTPFFSGSTGYRLDSIGFEVLRSIAQILQRTQTEITATLARRLLQLFEEQRMDYRDDGTWEASEVAARWGDSISKASKIGWRPEHAPVPPKPVLWASAVAVQALHRVIRMLDVRINESVLQHFSVKHPGESGSGLRLEGLIYPDFGLSLAPEVIRKPLSLNNSVAMHLELLRAHIQEVKLPERLLQGKKLSSKLFSAVLYGPPGTGKTTLVEALARSCEVPLVEISPSDIVQSGEEEIEKRAREIFVAMSMLTDVVILLDEILRDRERVKREAPSLFKLLTPGMLPKLTKLYEAAADQRIAYCLVTNHIEQIDEAALRSGRFDVHVPILPPDPLARAGAVAQSILRDSGKISRKVVGRMLVVVSLSGGVQVSRFAKEWLRKPGRETSDGTVGDYIVKGVELDEVGILADAQERLAGRSDESSLKRPEWTEGGADTLMLAEEVQAALEASTKCIAEIANQIADRFLGSTADERRTAIIERWLKEWDESLWQVYQETKKRPDVEALSAGLLEPPELEL